MRGCWENCAITATRSLGDSPPGARSTRIRDRVVLTTERANITMVQPGSPSSAQSSQWRSHSPGQGPAHLTDVVPALGELLPRVVKLCLCRGEAGSRRPQLPTCDA